jgi:hypothetical protein
MGGEWSTPRPGRFTSGKDTVPIVQEGGWTPGPGWTGAESLYPLPGYDLRTVKSVSSVDTVNLFLSVTNVIKKRHMGCGTVL